MTTARSGPRRRRRRWIGAAVGAATVAALGIGAWVVWPGADDPAPAQVEMSADHSSGSPRPILVVARGQVDVPTLRVRALRLGHGDAIVRDGRRQYRLTIPVVVGPRGRLEIENVTLRLSSGPQGFAWLDVRGGTVSATGATFVSWDPSSGAPDPVVEDGRAYVYATDRSRIEVVRSRFESLGYQHAGRTGVVFDAGTEGFIRGTRFVANVVGLGAADLRRLEVSGCEFERSATAGLTARSVGGVDVRSSTFRANAADGLQVLGRSSGVRVRGVQAHGNAGAGIAVAEQSRLINVKGAQLHNNRDAGIKITDAAGVDVVESTVWANHVGALVTGRSSSVTLTGNRLSGNRVGGIRVEDEGTSATLVDNQLDHNGAAGVFIGDGTTVIGPGNVITSNDAGIRVVDQTPDVTVHDNLIEKNYDVGVNLVVANGLRMTGNRIVGNLAAPFSVRRGSDSVRFAQTNTILPSRRGWEIVRAGVDPPPPTTDAQVPVTTPPTPSQAVDRP